MDNTQFLISSCKLKLLILSNNLLQCRTDDSLEKLWSLRQYAEVLVQVFELFEASVNLM